MDIPPEYVRLVTDVSEMTSRINNLRETRLRLLILREDYKPTRLYIKVPPYKKLVERMSEINKYYKLYDELRHINQKINKINEIKKMHGNHVKGKCYTLEFNKLVEKGLVEGEELDYNLWDSDFSEKCKMAEDKINKELKSLNSKKMK